MTGGRLAGADLALAAKREPLLRGHQGNARRLESLDAIRAGLQAKKGNAHAGLLDFVGSMGPDSALAAWERLYYVLRETDPPLARIAALEYRLTRPEIWGAMRTGADMIPHLSSICDRCGGRRLAALGEMRDELAATLSHVAKSVRPGPEMHDYIVNMARFDSMAGGEMAGMIVDELYIRRGLLGEACDICDAILRFDIPDRDMAASSTMVEDTVLNVLGCLDGHDEAHRVLASRCREILELRSNLLGLGTRPDPGDANTLRALSTLATSISLRKRLYPAKELGMYIGAHYPKSHKFLGLGKETILKRMVEIQSPLAFNASVHIDSQKVDTAYKMTRTDTSALAHLEMMLEGLDRTDASHSALKRWIHGMRGAQLWEGLFEMEVYLRLFGVGASVTLGRKVGGGEVDVEFDGCYADAYSPLEARILDPGSVGTLMGQATGLVRRAQSKQCLQLVGEHETMMIIECPPSTYTGVAHYEDDVRNMLGQSAQPGGALFVKSTRNPRRDRMFVPNPAAVAPVSDKARDIAGRAMDLDLPAAIALGLGSGAKGKA